MARRPVPDDRLSARRRAEYLAAPLPPLLVAAERVAATVTPGGHVRRRVGPGETFWQYRRYQPGDPATAIDWRRSARSRPLFVRELEWEATASVWLWCDRSPSMAYGSRLSEVKKGDRASLLTLALAVLLVRGGEQIALLGHDRAPGRGRLALERLAARLMAPPPAEAPSTPPPLAVPRHAEMVLIGDWLASPDAIETALRYYAQSGIKGHVLQVLDPAEEEFPFSGRVRFEGLEDEGRVLIGRSEEVRDDYRAQLAAHRELLRSLCRRFDWSFSIHRTDRPPQTALLALHAAVGGLTRAA